jgi:starch phosphorylase
VTPRRWIKVANPGLSHLLNNTIGEGWVTHLDELKKLAPFAEDPNFRAEFARIKKENKEILARHIYAEHEVQVNLDSIFDVQVKRIHEYKRQLLNLFHVIHLYLQIKDHPDGNWVPRTVIFSGKAAPGYFVAKRIIKLINAVADKVNHDPSLRNHLKVLFLENYRVSLAERIIPAADLSEQISTAGTEASGTGNMKLALNGALTICTLDGANIEMIQEAGIDNFFVFGLKEDEIVALKGRGYHPWDIYQNTPALKRVMDAIQDGTFSGSEDKEFFKPVIDHLFQSGDPYCLCADFDAYIECQGKVRDLYHNHDEWTKKTIRTVAGMGKFSSDRTIEDYAKEIWRLT